MRFGQGLAFVFSESWAFLRRAWWLALLPSVPLLGYTVSYESLPSGWDRAVFWSAFGLTALLQTAAVYWVMRFVALDHDLVAALSVNRNSARTFAPYFAVMSLLTFAWLTGSYYTGTLSILASVGFVLFLFPLLSPWSVTAPSGSTVIGPIRSIGLVLPRLPWAMALIVVSQTPVALLQLAAGSLLLALPDGTVAEQSLSFLAITTVNALINACSDLLFVVTLFVIADCAGLRLDKDKEVTAIFE